MNAKSKRARFLGAGDACEEEEAIDFYAPILAADTLDVEDVLPPRHRREVHQSRNEKKAAKTRPGMFSVQGWHILPLKSDSVASLRELLIFLSKKATVISMKT